MGGWGYTGRLLAFLALVVMCREPMGVNFTTAVRLEECWVMVILPLWLMNIGPVTVLFALVVVCIENATIKTGPQQMESRVEGAVQARFLTISKEG